MRRHRGLRGQLLTEARLAARGGERSQATSIFRKPRWQIPASNGESADGALIMGAPKKVITDGAQTCTKCGEMKPLQEFHRHAIASTGRRPDCKICVNAKNGSKRRIRQAMIMAGKLPCTKCGEMKPLEEFHRTPQTSTGRRPRCKTCVCKQVRDHFKNCASYRERVRTKEKRKRVELRTEVVVAYGGRCVCCGEAMPEFLTIDHIYNDGAKHRREISRETGRSFYRWLKENGYPKDRFQLLCFNCNITKGFYGKCAHAMMQK